MTDIFDNAVTSIRLGIEDYQSNDDGRVLSSVRNYYSGVILLAKEVLIRQVPDADPSMVIGVNFKPIPDGKGNVEVVHKPHKTVDTGQLAERFKDFGLKLDRSLLSDLSRIRNDIEHRATKESHERIREAIATSFPVVLELFNQAEEKPDEHLKDVWETIMSVRSAYEHELSRCQATFQKISWNTVTMAHAPFKCPLCRSELVEQLHKSNTKPHLIEARCITCTSHIAAEDGISTSLEIHLDGDSYLAAKEGQYSPLHDCPECNNHSYITSIDYDESKCELCELELGKCNYCEDRLHPEDLAWDDYEVCSYCSHKLEKLRDE